MDSQVAEIEAEIAATRARISGHIDMLKRHLHPVDLLHDAATAGIDAAMRLPRRLTPGRMAAIAGTLGAVALLLTLRSSSQAAPAPRPD